jgi:hypothetical protein
MEKLMKGEKGSMDEMKIVSKFTRGIVSKIVTKAVRKKTGCSIDIRLNEFTAKVSDEGRSHVHLDIDAELDKDELMKLLKDLGMN